MNPHITAGLVYEYTTVELMVVQRLDERNTLLVFAESEDIGKLCSTLQSIEMWMDHSVNTGCDVATPKQIVMGNQLCWVGRQEGVCQWKAQTHSYLSQWQSLNAIFPVPV